MSERTELLYRAAQEIISTVRGQENGPVESVYSTMQASISVVDGVVLDGLRVVRLESHHDFNESFVGGLFCTLEVSTLEYDQYLGVSDTDILVTLKRTTPSEDVPLTQEQSFRGLIIDGGSASASGVDTTVPLDTGIKTLYIELLDDASIETRTVGFSAIYRNCTVEQVMRAVLAPRGSQATYEDWLSGNYSGVVGLDIVPPTQLNVFKQIVIPYGTLRREVPIYLQETYGVYEYGLSSYMHRGMLYIYPPYRIDKDVDSGTGPWSEARPKLTVLLDRNTASGTVSYHVDPEGTGDVHILAPGPLTMTDQMVSNLYQEGTTVEYAKASPMMDVTGDQPWGTLRLEGGGIKQSVARNTNLVQSQFGGVHGNSQKQVASVSVTDNHLAAASVIAPMGLEVATLIWNNSSPDLLIPGMAVLILRPENRGVRATIGILAGVNTTAIAIDEFDGAHGVKLNYNSILSLYVRPEGLMAEVDSLD